MNETEVEMFRQVFGRNPRCDECSHFERGLPPDIQESYRKLREEGTYVYHDKPDWCPERHQQVDGTQETECYKFTPKVDNKKHEPPKIKLPKRVSKKLQLLKDFFESPSHDNALGELIRRYAAKNGYFKQFIVRWIENDK